MLKYVMTATALKAFSATPQTKKVYRLLGNSLGQKKRMGFGLGHDYSERVKLILAACEKHQAVQPGNRLLEIGTGWIHWEATIIRLFYDVEITLFDVWDNRQFKAYKLHMGQLDRAIDTLVAMDDEQHERVHALLRAIGKASSFEEIYAILGFHYVIHPDGRLKHFADQSFDVIFSTNVMEHVDPDILPEFVRDFYRLLKPGGYSIHQIDPSDHLAYYDPGVSLKNYLRYSEKAWRRFFANEVQYFNRIQRSQWLQLFTAANLELIEEEAVNIDISSLQIAKCYQHFSEEDLRCITMRVVHKRPE